MDTEKQYILMCSKAVEIQKKWKYENRNYGDFWWCEVLSFTNGRGLNYDIQERGYETKYTWLPRQDQLQEIVFGSNIGVQTISTAIEQFSKSEIGVAISITGTMEQLWLAYTMKTLYSKKWNGTDWVKE